MAHQSIEVKPVSGALGAEVANVDLSEDLSNQTFDQIHQVFLDHLVVIFRDQRLTPQRQVEIARRFGSPAIYPFLKGLDDAPEVNELIKTPDDAVNFGGCWHSDTAYKDRPDMGTLLYAHEVPAAGGDTLFANMYLAYDALSDGMKRLVDGLIGVNDSEKHYPGGRSSNLKGISGMKDAVDVAAESLQAEHPIVRTHPETGRKGLYVSHTHTLRFKGMTVEESEPLINYLADFAVRPEFTCRLRWAPRTLAVWDNRCTQHFAVNDYVGCHRHMHRVTIEGDRPQ